MAIVVLGSVFVDIKGYPFAQLVPDGRNAGRVEQVHGGVARNIVEDVANVELRPVFVSLVDEGGIGDDVIRKLKNHKVDTRYIRRSPDGMGTWLAVFDQGGDVYASVSKRPDLLPIADILEDEGDAIFRDADSILLELDLEKEVVRKVFQLAKAYGKPVYAAVSNMPIAMERRDYLQSVDCFVCNVQEAGVLFSANYEGATPEEMQYVLSQNVIAAQIPRMVVTMGSRGAVYADIRGDCGFCPANKVAVKDTTGAGDAFFSGVAIGLTYGKSLAQACQIGTRLAASVICTTESVCPRFLPEEFGLDVAVN